MNQNSEPPATPEITSEPEPASKWKAPTVKRLGHEDTAGKSVEFEDEIYDAGPS